MPCSGSDVFCRDTLPPSGVTWESIDYVSNIELNANGEKNAVHIHITRKGRGIQMLGQEQRGMRRKRPYQFKGWRKFHA